MKKAILILLIGWVLCTCTYKREPTLHEIVIGTYDISNWLKVDTITSGSNCDRNSYLVIRENQQGLLEVEAFCMTFANGLRDKRTVSNLEIRNTPPRKIGNSEVLYELYHPSTNLSSGFFFKYPPLTTFFVTVQSKTIQGDSVVLVGGKPPE